jgi:hypothetical protein
MSAGRARIDLDVIERDRCASRASIALIMSESFARCTRRLCAGQNELIKRAGAEKCTEQLSRHFNRNVQTLWKKDLRHFA